MSSTLRVVERTTSSSCRRYIFYAHNLVRIAERLCLHPSGPPHILYKTLEQDCYQLMQTQISTDNPTCLKLSLHDDDLLLIYEAVIAHSVTDNQIRANFEAFVVEVFGTTTEPEQIWEKDALAERVQNFLYTSHGHTR
jgi:hypothetical protein